MFETRPTGDRPTSSQCVRFSFEATSLRKAVDVADRLRRANGSGVRVRPAQVSGAGSCRWEILVTAAAVDTSEVSDVEQEMRRVALEEPGIRFTGWVLLSGSP